MYDLQKIKPRFPALSKVTLERRAFIAVLTAPLFTSCDWKTSHTRSIFYANNTGHWLEGIISIGDSIYDKFSLSPYGVMETTARRELLEYQRFQLSAQDMFSGERFTTSGTIGACSNDFNDPSLQLLYHKNGVVKCTWQERANVGFREYLLQQQSIETPMHFAIAKQSIDLNAMRIAVRQRPEKFVTDWYVVDYRHEEFETYLFDVSLLISPLYAWDCTLFLYTDMTIDSANTWRDTFDLREVPGFESPNSILWIEVERNGQYKLAWKRHPETSERQLREQLQRDELEPPQDWLVRQAQPHDELTLVSLHRGNQTKIPDLRFDDEIAQQKQKP
jgi:hypothetical protein